MYLFFLHITTPLFDEENWWLSWVSRVQDGAAKGWRALWSWYRKQRHDLFLCLKTAKGWWLKDEAICTWSCYFYQVGSWENNWVGFAISLFGKVPAPSERAKWVLLTPGLITALIVEEDVLMACQRHVGDTAWGSFCCFYPPCVCVMLRKYCTVGLPI